MRSFSFLGRGYGNGYALALGLGLSVSGTALAEEKRPAATFDVQAPAPSAQPAGGSQASNPPATTVSPPTAPSPNGDVQPAVPAAPTPTPTAPAAGEPAGDSVEGNAAPNAEAKADEAEEGDPSPDADFDAPPVYEPPVEAPEPNVLARNSTFVEGLGPAMIYSLNYERLFGEVGIRIGVGGVGSSNQYNSNIMVAVPITISYLGIRDRKNIFEIGGGGSIVYGSSSNNSVNVVSATGTGGLVTLYGGYRLHPVDKVGFQFRVGLGVQALFVAGQTIIYPWPYLSLGAGF
jgi:hypothetical protein